MKFALLDEQFIFVYENLQNMHSHRIYSSHTHTTPMTITYG